MKEKKYRMYADFSEEAYNALKNGEAVFNNGFREKKGNFYPDQPEFSDIDDEETSREADIESESNKNSGDDWIYKVLLGTAMATIGYVFAKRKDISAWFTNKGIPKVKNAWNIMTKKDTSEIEGKQQTTAELDVSDFSSEVDTVLNEYYVYSDNEDSQKKLIKIVLLAAALAKEIREYSGVRVNKNDPDYIEIQREIEKLTTQQITDSINTILKKSPAFLKELPMEAFDEIFGCYKSKEFVPIQNETIKQALSIKTNMKN